MLLILAQLRSCLDRVRIIRRGRTVCQNFCSVPGQNPTLRCITARIRLRIAVCPLTCCRTGTTCNRL